MPGLGSVTEGMVGTQLDLQNIQLNQFKLAEAPMKLQEEAINLQKEKIGLAQQVKMLSLMQNLKPPGEANTPDTIADVLNQYAMIQAESGMPDAAAKTAGEASRILESASKTDYRSYRMQNDRLSKFANVLSAVPDTPDGFSQAIQAIMAGDPRAQNDPKFKALVQRGWSPGLIPKLQAAVLTEKEQAEVRYRGAAAKHAEAATILDEHRVALVDQQTKTSRARELAVGKEGGLITKADDRKAITDMVFRDYEGADAADVAVRVRPLAEEMVKLRKEQHLTTSEAATRVYERARSSGVFQGLRMTPVLPGTKPGKPRAIPEGAQLKDLRQNSWYLFDGVPKLILGSKAYSEDELAAMDEDDKAELGLEEDDLREAQ